MHIALESRLSHCGNVMTLGVKPNLDDYSTEAIELIRNSNKIYYPSSFHAELFNSMGKNTFPSLPNYLFAQDKIKQTAMFNLLNIPHPRTRIFYGKRQKASILNHFRFPFIAKIPRGSAMGRGVFLIQDSHDLSAYLDLNTPAYIQEFLPLERDMRVVVIGKEIAHAYWRINAAGEFKSNLAVGGQINLDPLPQEALDLALKTAHACQWDDVGLDICLNKGKLYILEANMKYGKQGFRAAGIDYNELMFQKIETGKI